MIFKQRASIFKTYSFIKHRFVVFHLTFQFFQFFRWTFDFFLLQLFSNLFSGCQDLGVFDLWGQLFQPIFVRRLGRHRDVLHLNREEPLQEEFLSLFSIPQNGGFDILVILEKKDKVRYKKGIHERGTKTQSFCSKSSFFVQNSTWGKTSKWINFESDSTKKLTFCSIFC